MIVNQNSLAVTLNNLNSAFLSGIKLGTAERKTAANFIASRQGLPGSYWNMFAPTARDFKGVRLFTNDKLTTKAGISHILGEESLRALYSLGVKSEAVSSAIRKAKLGIESAIKRHNSLGYYSKGFYCCGKCTAAYWRNLSAESNETNRKVLNAGVKILSTYRDGSGKWRVFPFIYTVLALSDIDLPSARAELQYAEPALVRIAHRNPGKNHSDKLRHNIAVNALSLLFR